MNDGFRDMGLTPRANREGPFSTRTRPAIGARRMTASGARLCENARSGCSHATIESKAQLRRIFDACAACRLNQSCAQMARRMVFAQPRADAYLAAGYALARAAASRNAYRLRNRQDVAARIAELSAKARGCIAAEQIAEGIRRGAPTLYRPELAELSRRLALLGATDQEMADALGIDQVTLDYDQARPPAA